MHPSEPAPGAPESDGAQALPDDPYAVTEAVATGRTVAADPIDVLIARQRWLRIAIVAAPVAWLVAWAINWSYLVVNPLSAAYAAPWLLALVGYVLVTAGASARVAWLTGVDRWAGVAMASLALVPLLGVATMAWLHVRANRALRAHGFITRWHGPLF